MGISWRKDLSTFSGFQQYTWMYTLFFLLSYQNSTRLEENLRKTPKSSRKEEGQV
jgi:hypothetical protein